MSLPASVRSAIKQLFATQDQEEIESVLSSYGEQSYEQEHERVLLDVLKLAGNDKAQVKELVQRAKHDYRDIILWAEYPSQSWLDTPQKVGQFNAMLKKYGAKWQVNKEQKDS